MKRVLSFGAGVQSTTVLMMSIVGELPPLDAAVFADTGDEPQDVYKHLQWCRGQCDRAGVKLLIVDAGAVMSEHIIETIREGRRVDSPPLFVQGKDGNPAIINRSCTSNFKIAPIRRAVKKHVLGLAPRARYPKEVTVEQWLGISWDERRRCKVSVESWMRFWHPLIEDQFPDGKSAAPYRENPITRAGCLEWMGRHGFPEPPRSACWHCPFRSDAGWRRMKERQPDEFEKACQFDEAIREHDGFLHGLGQHVYVHRSLKPLREVDFRGHPSLFGDECGGVCGV